MVCLESECRTVYVIDCESPFDVITSPGTTIISPNYPDRYGVDLICETTITFENRVSLTFEYFRVSDYHCYDWLEVRDGDSSESEMIGNKLCGSSLPNEIEST